MAFLPMESGGSTSNVESLSWFYAPSKYNWLNFTKSNDTSQCMLQGGASPSSCNGKSEFFTCSHASNYTETFTILKDCKITYLHKRPTDSYSSATIVVTKTAGSTIVFSPLVDGDQLLYMRFEEV